MSSISLSSTHLKICGRTLPRSYDQIYQDPDAESPREWCNLGTLICWHRRYRLDDNHRFDSPHAFLRDLAGVSDPSDHDGSPAQPRGTKGYHPAHLPL